MRVRQRSEAVRKYVATRHGRPDDDRLQRLADKAPFRKGDRVYRKGRPCTVVLINYETSPPHAVVCTEDGNEVGTELDRLSRKPQPDEGGTADCRGNSAPAGLGDDDVDSLLMPPPDAEVAESCGRRREALARVRQRVTASWQSSSMAMRHRQPSLRQRPQRRWHGLGRRCWRSLCQRAKDGACPAICHLRSRRHLSRSWCRPRRQDPCQKQGSVHRP